MPFAIGLLLLGFGLVMVMGSVPAIHRAAERWPRVHDRASVDLLTSGAFAVRFVGLMLLLAGVGVLLSQVIGG